MNAYEKILKIIRESAIQNQSYKIELGIYENGGIRSNDILIPSSMIYKLDFLDKKRAIMVKGNIDTGGGGDSSHTHGWTDKSEYIDELKNGDLIAYQQLNMSKFLIIGRVAQ